jgi:hypothetical protein
MKVTSNKPRGQRIFNANVKLHLTSGRTKTQTTKIPIWIEPIGKGWWFSLRTGEWVQGYDSSLSCVSSYYSMEMDGYKNIWSLKAAKRAIANWDVPKGTWFMVALPYVGYEFKIRKS